MFDVVPQNGQTWLICGGRGFTDRATFDSAMGDLIRMKGCPQKIIHGAAPGADTLADRWAEHMAIGRHRFPAQWEMYGKAAGPIRNQAMLDKGRPHLVVAFPGGHGTSDMVRRAREAGLEVAEIRLEVAGRKALEEG